MPLLAVLAPALGALLIARTGERRANLREFWSVAAGVVMFALVARMVPEVLAGGTPQCVLFQLLCRLYVVLRGDHAIPPECHQNDPPRLLPPDTPMLYSCLMLL